MSSQRLIGAHLPTTDASRASGDAFWAVLWLPDALRGRRAAAVAVEVSGLRRLLFAIKVDDGGGFRAATAAEVDAALR